MSMLGRMFGFGRNEDYDRGLRFFDQGLYEQAIEELQKVVAEESRADSLSRRLASFYIAESYSNLGGLALQKQAYESAQKYLKQALDLNPHYADLYLHYGRACRKLGEQEAAKDAFEEALRINPRFAKARFYHGVALYDLDKPKEALSAIEKAVELEPGFRTDLYEKAIVAHGKSDYSTARDIFEQIGETDVDDIAYHVRLGADLYRRGMYDQAIEEFGKALAINANYADLRNHLAIAYNAKGMHDDAIRELNQALEINPHYVEARTNLGLTLRAAGHSAEADEQFKKVLEIDPDNLVAQGYITP